MILITFIMLVISIYALYKIYNDKETTFKPLDPNYNSEEMNKHAQDGHDFVSENVSIPKSIICNMKAAENEEANKVKKILSDIPKKRKTKYKRNNRAISNSEYIDENLVDNFLNSNVIDVLSPSVYLASEILENFNSKNDVIEEPVYNHYEEARNRQAERASAVEDNSYSYSGYGSGGGGGSSSDWSDSGSSSSYDSGSSDSGGSDD